jgi:hypothetical protein
MDVRPIDLTAYRKSRLEEKRSSSEDRADTLEYDPEQHDISFMHVLDEMSQLICDICGNDSFHATKDPGGTLVECTECHAFAYIEDD